MAITTENFKSLTKALLSKCLPLEKPAFIIVGAQKSGTTALHHYLTQHPRLMGSRPKEVDYFSNEINFAKGKNWYHKAFINTKDPLRSILSFEATPEYLYYDFVPERIYYYNPDIKIIIVLREPISRCYSAWNMFKYFKERNAGIPKQLGTSGNRYHKDFNQFFSSDNFPDFETCVKHELNELSQGRFMGEPSFVRRGLYLEQIKRYVKLFGRDKVYILGFKDITGSAKSIALNSVLEFIGLPNIEWDFLRDTKKNSRTYEEPMGESINNELIRFYDPHNKDLFEYLGYKINW